MIFSVSRPAILIVNGANWLGSNILEVIIKNQGNVVIVDDFCEATIPFIKRFSDKKHFVFIEKDKLESVRNNFEQIKYVIHLKNNTDLRDDIISSKYFIAETKFADAVLTIALEKNSRYLLVSSIHLHKDFTLKRNFVRTENAYTESDLQEYIEKTVFEYNRKAGLNARVVRLGNVYGPGMDLRKDFLLMRIFADALYRDSIRIYGDGLEFMYYVYISDAVDGILKSILIPGTEGKVYSITNPEEISVLSLVNKVLQLNPRAKKVDFLPSREDSNPLYEKAYTPDPNLSEIGWSPSVDIGKGLSMVYEYFVKEFSNRSDNDFIEGDYYTGRDSTLDDDIPSNVKKFDGEGDLKIRLDDFHKSKSNVKKIVFINASDEKDSRISFMTNESKNNFKNALKILSLFFLCLFLIFFIFIPGVKIALLYSKVKDNSTKLLQNVGNDASYYKVEIGDTNFEQDIADAVYPTGQIFLLFGQRNYIEQYKTVFQGLDMAFYVYNKIKKDNLVIVIYSEESLTQEDYINLSTLLADIRFAKDRIKVQGAQPPLGLSESLNSIAEWLEELDIRITQRITKIY